MSDDLLDSDVADQPRHDIFLECLTDSASAKVSSYLGKAVRFTGVLKTASNRLFLQKHVIDVGDVPGHQVRILELHRTPSNAKPNCEGLKVVEAWSRGYSDYTNLNGRAWGYDVTVLENGDKIFGQWSGTTQTTFSSDGTKKTLYTGVTTFTGGTGKYRGVRGTSRVTSAFDPKTGFNETQWEDEYWIET